MVDFRNFNINGVDASIALATDTEDGLMSAQEHITLSDISSGVNLNTSINDDIIYPNDIITVSENPEFIDVKTDSIGKILESTDYYGNKTFYTDATFNNLSVDGDLNVDGSINCTSGIINISSIQCTYIMDNSEFLDITLDSSNKIIEGTTTDGTKILGPIKSPTIDELKDLIPTDEYIQELISNNTNAEEYDHIIPPYIFDIESGTYSGREFMTSLYPEGIAGELVKLKIDGGRKKIMKTYKNSNNNATYSIDLQTTVYDYELNGSGLKSIDASTIVYKTNRSIAQNKSIRVLCIGDSLTQAVPYWPDSNYGGRGYVASIECFALKDNKDIGDISVLMVGTQNKIEENFVYNDEQIAMRSFAEGRSGWASYGYANYPLYVRLDGGSSGFMGVKGMYYLSGLATKTPYDSSVASQDWTDVADITASNTTAYQDIIFEICNTPVGKYKPDYCETLWTALQIYSDFPDRSSSYTSSTSNEIMEDYLFNESSGKLLFPDNPFYDYDKAKTDEIAFSIEKYLERYKTLDDDGITRLTIDDTAGSMVTDISSYDVCTPTHIIITLGTNDQWLTASNSAIFNMKLLQASVFNSTVKVGWQMKRGNYVLDEQTWYDIGMFMEGINTTLYSRNKKMMELIGTILTESQQIYYIPSYFTHCNTMGINGCINEDAEKLFASQSIVSSVDGLHGDVYGYCTMGHQILSWIYYTLV